MVKQAHRRCGTGSGLSIQGAFHSQYIFCCHMGIDHGGLQIGPRMSCCAPSQVPHEWEDAARFAAPWRSRLHPHVRRRPYRPQSPAAINARRATSGSSIGANMDAGYR